MFLRLLTIIYFFEEILETAIHTFGLLIYSLLLLRLLVNININLKKSAKSQ